MSIRFVRIDDRLLHGQVATTWTKTCNIEQIIIVNDKVANDEVQKTVMQLACPAGVKLVTLSVDRFIQAYNSAPIKRVTMLIYNNPSDVEKTLAGGVEIPYLNVGGMKFIDGKKQLTRAVSVDEKDKVALKKIIEMGVKVEIQMVPGDTSVLINELLDK